MWNIHFFCITERRSPKRNVFNVSFCNLKNVGERIMFTFSVSFSRNKKKKKLNVENQCKKCVLLELNELRISRRFLPSVWISSMSSGRKQKRRVEERINPSVPLVGKSKNYQTVNRPRKHEVDSEWTAEGFIRGDTACSLNIKQNT